MPSILGANTLSSGDIVTNSLRFNAGSEDSIDRTPGSAGNQKKFTFSTWIKRSRVGAGSGPEEFLMYGRPGSNTDTRLYFTGDGDANDDRLYFQSTTSNTTHTALQTNRKFRDTSAWYNIVISANTEDGNGSSSTIQMFINGVKETSFATETYGSQNKLFYWTDDALTTIGRRSENNGQHFSGYVAETVLIDGSALDADSFGEFDSDSGIWKPIDVSGLTFGDNGFYLEFKETGTSQNASGIGADTSGNGNHVAVTNITATDISTDTCTNNFATWNGLDFYHNATANTGSTSTEGSLRFANASGNKGFARSTFAVSAGKWYWEIEANSVGKGFYGVCHEGIMVDGTALQPSAVYYYENVPDFRSGDEIVTTNAVSISAGDILGFALDMDNYALYISKNGTYMNSGNPASGSSRTGSIAEEFTNGRAVLSDFGAIFANVANTSTSGALDASANFGSPHYSESGGNADGNGFGNFKTAPPSGYLALCTKNLGSTGG